MIEGAFNSYHFVYQTTNVLTGRRYVGKHSTDDINDGYLGSGNALLAAIHKYGSENFSREILSFHSTEEEAYRAEAKIVTQEFVDNRGTYNLLVGGNGRQAGVPLPQIVKSRISRSCKDFYVKHPHHSSGTMHSDSTKMKIGDSLRGRSKPTTECEHCGLVLSVCTYGRWHGGNCKSARVQ